MAKDYTIQDFLNIKHSASPSFSASGEQVAFLSNETGTWQIYNISRNGENRRQLTDAEDGAGLGIYSPADENKLIYAQDEGGNEKYQLYLMDTETDQVQALTSQPEVKHTWGGWSRDGQYISFASNERNGKDFDVYVMDLETREVELVFDLGSWSEGAGFSPRGSYLVVAQEQKYERDYDLHLVDLETKEIEPITPKEKEIRYRSLSWLPDESGFYLVSNEDADLSYLSFYDLSQGTSKPVIQRDYETTGISLTEDGEFMAVAFNQDGYSKLELFEEASMEPMDSEGLPEGMITSFTWSRDGQYAAFNFYSSTKNTNVWVWGRSNDKAKQITHSPMGVEENILVEPTLHKFESFDGLEVPYFKYLPRGVSPQEKLPAIFYIHGGPESQFRPTFKSLVQYYTYQGYAVVAPNVRGSSGYGKQYMDLDNVENRMDSVKDMVELGEHLAEDPQIDEDRIALMGGSYGGFMVLAGLAFYPDLWAVGVDTVGIASFVTFLENTAEYRRKLREAEYGSLEHDRKFLESVSPLNYVEDIQAPLLIIHGANDPRVPLSEAKQIKEKLDELGRRAELLVYEDEGHGLSKLKNRLDAYPKVADFLDKILKE